MADIQAFHGLRYDLSRVGSLGSVVAPPYDVIDADLQQGLYERNEYNVVRLILNRGDDLLDGQSIYERAAEHFRAWRKDGILKPEHEGSVYVYHQTFSFEGQTYTRRGFLSRVRLERFGEGSIYPHEQTHSAAKEDRFKLMSACKANLSPVFGIFPDEENLAQELLEAAIEDRTPLQVNDADGVEHKLWIVTDTDAIAHVAERVGSQPVFIADGHHRYETACNYRDVVQQHGLLDRDHPSNYTLMMLVSMSDPGLAVLPTHRLLRGVDPISSSELIQRLGPSFACESIGSGPELANEAWDMVSMEQDQGTLGLYCRADNQWVLAQITEEGRDQMRKRFPQRSAAWCELGVALLHHLVIEDLLGHSELPSPLYVHSIEEVKKAIEEGDSAGRDATGQAGSGAPFELACLVMPATVDHVKAISESLERMPAKSTYFYPKVLSGLVINPLE